MPAGWPGSSPFDQLESTWSCRCHVLAKPRLTSNGSLIRVPKIPLARTPVAHKSNPQSTVPPRRANEIIKLLQVVPPLPGDSRLVIPTYDAAGLMTSIPRPGHPTEELVPRYDGWGRLMHLSGPDRSFGFEPGGADDVGAGVALLPGQRMDVAGDGPRVQTDAQAQILWQAEGGPFCTAAGRADHVADIERALTRGPDVMVPMPPT